MLNLNFHTFKGQLDAYCDGVRTGNGGKIYEDWVVFCDDNKNGELDEDEQKVQFETVYDYVYTGTDPKNFKGIDKNHSEFQNFSIQNLSSHHIFIINSLYQALRRGKTRRIKYAYLRQKEKICL